MSIYLVRHASAGIRTPSTSDVDRPLDETGELQAERLSDMLSWESVERVLSSPTRRCVQTVEPLATSLGLTVETADCLNEGQPEQHAMALMRRLASAGSSAVLCSHGDMIPLLLDAAAATGVPLAGSGCAKGSVWRFSVVDGQINDGRYLGKP